MRKVTKESKLRHDKMFARMVYSAIIGIIMVTIGTILFVSLFPEIAWLLSIFLVYVVICRILEITKWSERHGFFYGLFIIILLMIFAGTIAWWGYNGNERVLLNVPPPFIIIGVERMILIALIFFGSMGFLSLFQRSNYRHVEVEN